MKIATWNVNGIRARQQQVLEWLERDKPDIVCLQELKAPREKVPEDLSEMQDYWCCWHGERAYSGVGLLVKRDLSSTMPEFLHPEFDFETRIVTAQVGSLRIGSVYVPNGGKDFPARFAEALPESQNSRRNNDRSVAEVLFHIIKFQEMAGRTVDKSGHLNRSFHPPTDEGSAALLTAGIILQGFGFRFDGPRKSNGKIVHHAAEGRLNTLFGKRRFL